ncbi:MAG: glutamate-1-semialdehyde 2,1-aminomutase [Gemmatimonadota bacterium]|nr:glutamate-1-semialdehyde 2,1-aminomutase [Gemmatimonadota bacterium]
MSAGPRSAAIMGRAQAVMPGGVSSPVRAFRAVGGTPLVLRSGSGAEFEDADGRRYVDFVCSWGPLILGHAHPEVVAAIADAATRGTSFGAPSEVEVELAEYITSAYPGLDQVRFVSSGTEATMSAIRVARGATGRDRIVKFAGCYHGHADHLLVSAGSGLVTFGRPSSAGVPSAFVRETVVLPLDDEERVTDLLRREGHTIAAVIIEPVPANNGLLIQRPEFLRTLREETRRAGTILIFDEVISGFRLGRGGAAAHYGITPDLATFGKVIGGGLPVGAFGGRRDLMQHLAPLGGVYQAGTLSGNAVAMTAGLTTLRILERDNGWQRLDGTGAALEAALTPVLAAAPMPAQCVRLGSLFWIALQAAAAPRSAETIDTAAADRYRPVFHGLLARGIALAPSAYEAGFLSLAHAPGHIARLADGLRDAFAAGSTGANGTAGPVVHAGGTRSAARGDATPGADPDVGRTAATPRRAHVDRDAVLRFGGNVCDFHTLAGRSADGAEHTLGHKEAMVLRYLAEREGDVVWRDDLLEAVWGEEVLPSSRAVDALVVQLRRRFEPNPDAPRFIHGVRGVGYRFTTAPEGVA